MIDFRRASGRQWGQLLFGLTLYGVAITLMLRSELGLGPWDMFHQGIHNIFNIPVGMTNQLVGLALLIGLLFVRVRFGWGTIANIVFIGLVTDLTLPLVPTATTLDSISRIAGETMWSGGSLLHLGVQLIYYALALVMCGLATGAYIGANMGAGPRDSLMMMLSVRTGWPVRHVRTAIELVVLAGGWLMGGKAGVGTVLFALGIGPAAQWGLKLFGATPHRAGVGDQESGVGEHGAELAVNVK